MSSWGWSSNKIIFFFFFLIFPTQTGDEKNLWQCLLTCLKIFLLFSYKIQWKKLKKQDWVLRLFLLNFSKLNNILSIIFLSLSTIYCLKPVKPKLSNNNRSFFRWISPKFHQCVPGLFSCRCWKSRMVILLIFLWLCRKSLYILLLNLMSKHP